MQDKKSYLEYTRNALKDYIAAMLGTSSIGEYVVTSSMIGQFFPVEASIISEIEFCHARGIEIADAVIKAAIVRHHPHTDPDAYVDDLITRMGRHNSRTMGHVIKTYLKEVNAESVSNRLKDIMSNTSIHYEDRVKQALDVLHRVRLDTDTEEIVNHEQAVDYFEKRVNERIQSVQNGVSPGFNLPWASFRDAIGTLNEGESTLIFGPTSGGKSLIADHIAEYSAWEDGNTDAIILSVETIMNTMITRMFARGSMIPWRTIMSGEEDVTQFPSYQRFKNKIAGYANNRGWVHRIYDHNMDIHRCGQHMINYARISAAAGRRIVFILDVLQRVVYTGQRTQEHEQVAEIAESFYNYVKTANSITPAHGYLIAHESGDGTTSEVFGSKRVKKGAQLGLQIKRAKIDPVTETQYFNHGGAVDGLGDPIVYVREGETESPIISITVTKANNAAKTENKLVMLGEYAKIVEFKHKGQ